MYSNTNLSFYFRLLIAIVFDFLKIKNAKIYNKNTIVDKNVLSKK